MASRKNQINLLPKDEFEQSFWGKFLKWSLTVGRYIVIGTELVVIGSFLARFSLDRQVTDLNEAIAQKQAVIASYGDLEPEVRSIQKRLEVSEELIEQQLQTEEFLANTATFTPVDVAYNIMKFSKDEVVLSGVAFSEAGFRTLMVEVKSNESFSNVNLTRVSSEGDEGVGINFEIKMDLLQPTTTQAQAQTPNEQGDVDGF